MHRLRVIIAEGVNEPLGTRILYGTRTEAGLLNKSSRLASALSVTKFIMDIDMISIILCCAT